VEGEGRRKKKSRRDDAPKKRGWGRKGQVGVLDKCLRGVMKMYREPLKKARLVCAGRERERGLRDTPGFLSPSRRRRHLRSSLSPPPLAPQSPPPPPAPLLPTHKHNHTHAHTSLPIISSLRPRSSPRGTIGRAADRSPLLPPSTPKTTLSNRAQNHAAAPTPHPEIRSRCPVSRIDPLSTDRHWSGDLKTTPGAPRGREQTRPRPFFSSPTQRASSL
jgi:hypothetical protein